MAELKCHPKTMDTTVNYIFYLKFIVALVAPALLLLSTLPGPFSDIKCGLHIPSVWLAWLQVTFYGLMASSEMAAYVFEVAYNTVMEKGELEYGDKGAASQKMDYRCVVVVGSCSCMQWGLPFQ
jgi:hypothetical protein